MVAFSVDSPITAREVLAVGPQSVPVIETALITLAHLSVYSEDVEVEVRSFFVQQNYMLVCPV
jgi:ataxia telangiectasia mutated family protein